MEHFPRVLLASGRRWSGPFWDPRHGVYARQNYDDGLVTLALFGLRYPTAAEQNEVARRPTTLVTPKCNQTPNAQMASLAAARAADACIEQAVAAASGPFDALVTLKTWEHQPVSDPAHAWLHGMYVPLLPQPGGGYSSITQDQGRTGHNRSHNDYSQLLYGVELAPGESAGPISGGPLPLPGGFNPGSGSAAAPGAAWVGVGALVALASYIAWRVHHG